MKALTLKHPWAYCICHLGKRIENRSWQPPKSLIGQRIAIHGGEAPKSKPSKARVLDEALRLIHQYGRHIGVHDADYEDVVMTGIVAVVTLKGVLGPNEGRVLAWKDDGFYGWKLSDVVVLDRPVPCKGAQGLWDVPEDVMRLVDEQLRVSL